MKSKICKAQNNSGGQPRSHKRLIVGALPLLHDIAQRMKLREILSRYIKKHGNDRVHPVDTLLLLIYNLAIGKAPLYELEHWCGSLDLQRLDVEPLNVWNDDRFGSVLDKLYDVDRASLMTELVESYVETFSLELIQLHNDSTTVKAFGRIPGKTASGLELKYGMSKDHRDDLRQLVFNLSLTADGGIPIHHRCYPGNYTDDKTHIHTWNTLRRISGRTDFLYVGDSKLCTDHQLHAIVSSGGRVVTIVPETWKEVGTFKAQLRHGYKQKKVIWRRIKPGGDYEKEYFSVFTGHHTTRKRKYRIHWIYSSEKRKRDRLSREEALKKSETQFADLNARLNTHNLKTRDAIRKAVDTVLATHHVQSFMTYEIMTHTFTYRRQIGKGRPSKHTKYRDSVQTSFSLSWHRDRTTLRNEARIDGIFPLLCTDTQLDSVKVLKAYKYQPRLEKRFSQFKSIHNAAPLLFKKIERVEANMFAFFIALAIQSLLERQVRDKMTQEQIDKLYIYPEDRECKQPTASIIFDRFANVSKYQIRENGAIIESYRDELSLSQKEILKAVSMKESTYWQ
jgi:transposase